MSFACGYGEYLTPTVVHVATPPSTFSKWHRCRRPSEESSDGQPPRQTGVRRTNKVLRHEYQRKLARANIFRWKIHIVIIDGLDGICITVQPGHSLPIPVAVFEINRLNPFGASGGKFVETK